jgi:hypothetical protein
MLCWPGSADARSVDDEQKDIEMTRRNGIHFTQQVLCTNRDDPLFARYLIPLPNPDEEEMAHAMADHRIVGVHRSKLLRKLHARNSIELVRKALSLDQEA